MPPSRRTAHMLKDAPTRNGHAPADGPARGWRVAGTVRPARATRRLGRAPGTAAAVGLLLLAAVGVKATLAPRATPMQRPRTPMVGARDITEQGFAQAFARAYLSWGRTAP